MAASASKPCSSYWSCGLQAMPQDGGYRLIPANRCHWVLWHWTRPT
ncbi:MULTISPECIES: hypothetical protein [Pseudomonas]|uniref:Uncharacterized protein n=1 Tax=Pseudomonas putida TaxID=303 RepID=A0ABD7B6A5_PSEPU|nr:MULTISPECIES: hypothetical protein [Pseudomonas]EKT4450701.1 hypothetical protein [Pseudomonas putida]EKT4560503.1 hypothetical protein [Pseudomonas putida]MBH3452870.1 hypothetical protein [Pseudomonas putida]MBP2082689.1 hypothetical protein [Pseudomonas sp. PvP089]MBP2091607.1 hypothetical protein [Pseudomonas sp. PvP088]